MHHHPCSLRRGGASLLRIPALAERGRAERRMHGASAASRAKVKKHTSKFNHGAPEASGVPHAVRSDGFVRGAPGERSGFPPFAGLTLTAATTSCHPVWSAGIGAPENLRRTQKRSHRPARRHLVQGNRTGTTHASCPSAHDAVVIRQRFSRTGLRAPHRVHRIPPRVRDDRDTPLGGTG